MVLCIFIIWVSLSKVSCIFPKLSVRFLHDVNFFSTFSRPRWIQRQNFSTTKSTSRPPPNHGRSPQQQHKPPPNPCPHPIDAFRLWRCCDGGRFGHHRRYSHRIGGASWRISPTLHKTSSSAAGKRDAGAAAASDVSDGVYRGRGRAGDRTQQ